MSCCEIINNLWLGDIRCAKNKVFFDENNIEIVFNCSKDIPFYSNYTKNIRIKVNDNLEKKEINTFYLYLDKATKLIHESLLDSQAVLIHCYAGKQRSASLIAAYLMRYGHLSRTDAVSTIQSKRLVAFTPGINFKDALTQFEEDLLN